MDKNQNLYETNSLVLASTLVCLGLTLDSVIRDSSSKAIFVLVRTSNFDEILESFWKRQLQVEPNSFFEAQRFLKSRIYGG